MATPDVLASLCQTTKALKEIQTQLQPFIRILGGDTMDDDDSEDDDNIKDKPRRAQAQAAVALAVGTLRYMGSRLRGLDQGRKPDDPLRQELNQMRKVMVAARLKTKQPLHGGGASKPSVITKQRENAAPVTGNKEEEKRILPLPETPNKTPNNETAPHSGSSNKRKSPTVTTTLPKKKTKRTRQKE